MLFLTVGFQTFLFGPPQRADQDISSWQRISSRSDLLAPYFVFKPSEIFEHFLIPGCLKSNLGVFSGWFNGEFGRCMARSENNLWIATAVTLKNTFFGFVNLAAIMHRMWFDAANSVSLNSKPSKVAASCAQVRLLASSR
ncbi:MULTISPECIES: hypothetical protein [unclassified Bradyrhizobium]|uniref:hypothetical protein n=1 Tax=unclassified Bradyrhizobium TaxID=2631580 RepID=UPI002916ED56|nr:MULTISPECIES: hypothetical protein [unclassified Bradyrhizobium]